MHNINELFNVSRSYSQYIAITVLLQYSNTVLCTTYGNFTIKKVVMPDWIFVPLI